MRARVGSERRGRPGWSSVRAMWWADPIRLPPLLPTPVDIRRGYAYSRCQQTLANPELFGEALMHAMRWKTLGVLSLSLVIIGLDTTILNVALPTLQRELDASPSQLQWMLDAYLLVFAGLLLVCGTLGDRFGRKLALQAGVAIFGLASLGVLAVDSPGQLIAVRAVMGVGGALIMPAALSTAGFTALVYGIIEAPGRGWLSGVVVASLAAAVVLLVAFGWWERRVAEPMLDLGFFHDARFSVSTWAVSVAFFALLGGTFALTQYLQFAHGYTAIAAGAIMSPMTPRLIAGAGSSSRAVGRLGTGRVVAAGLAGLAGLLALTLLWDARLGALALVAWFLGLTLALGWVMAPATDAAVAGGGGVLVARLLPAGDERTGAGAAARQDARALAG